MEQLKAEVLLFAVFNTLSVPITQFECFTLSHSNVICAKQIEIMLESDDH